MREFSVSSDEFDDAPIRRRDQQWEMRQALYGFAASAEQLKAPFDRQSPALLASMVLAAELAPPQY